VREFLHVMGDPQDSFHAVHIAGTKGKGSIAAITESVLRHAGYKTGLFTSPHLHTFRERIRVDGDLIGQAEFAELVEKVRPAIEAVPGVTTFEIITGLAFRHFADRNVDVAVLEVGLGGRLDATNVVHPTVTALASLSYDHTELLGHTISLIAWEKAGIIKPGVPLITAPQHREAMEVVADVCESQRANLIQVGRDWLYEQIDADLSGQTFEVWPAETPGNRERFRIRLLGRHQVINATVAYALIRELSERGVPVPEDAIKAGMEDARWPGRFEILGKRPFVVVDSAHNADSAHKLQAAVEDLLPHRRMFLIFGASRDKDISGMLETLVPGATKVWATRSHHPRAASPEDVASRLRNLFPGREVAEVDEVWDAMAEALEEAGPEDLICVTGSIFVVAAAREFWYHRFPESRESLMWVSEAEWEALQRYRESLAAVKV
jgi:dihydrofolate synthase/folylpolyglutamate synthase